VSGASVLFWVRIDAKGSSVFVVSPIGALAMRKRFAAEVHGR